VRLAELETVRRLLENDRFAREAGIRLLEIREGYARASLEILPRHFNGVGTAQGGAIFTLADLVFAAAVNSHGTVAVAINVSISFVKAVTGGTIFAEGREVARNTKLASCTVHVTDEQGGLVAVFQGMAYRKKDIISEVLKSKEQKIEQS
jgi:acyl-CoA thioesterase